jgi:hypothetical protein
MGDTRTATGSRWQEPACGPRELAEGWPLADPSITAVILFDMRFLCCGLMSPPPERPCDDVGRLNSFLRETLGYAADFLDRPTDEVGCLGVALDFVFLGVGLLA